jgi:hypothetical protein
MAGVKMMKEGFDELQDINAQAEKVSGDPHYFMHAGHWAPLHLLNLRATVARELLRQCYRGYYEPNYSGPANLPFVTDLAYFLSGDLPHAVTPLDQLVEAENKTIIAGFENQLGLGKDPLRPAQTPLPPLPGLTPPGEFRIASPTADLRPDLQPRPAVPLREVPEPPIKSDAEIEVAAQKTLDDAIAFKRQQEATAVAFTTPLNPHPVWSPEAAEYDAALKRMAVRRGAN